MDFQCHLAQFVISNRGVMRRYLAANLNGGLKGNMIHSDEKREQLPGKMERQIGSAVYQEGVGEARNQR